MLDESMVAIMAITYALMLAGPVVRNQRDLLRQWNECRTAAKDALHKFQQLQASMARAKEATTAMGGLEPETAVQEVRRVRELVVRFLDDFDMALLGFDTLTNKFTGLNRRYGTRLAKTVPGFGEQLAKLPQLREEADDLKARAEKLREEGIVEQLDQMLDLAVEAATSAAITQSYVLAGMGQPLTGEDALAALRKVHDFARAHGTKLSA